MTVTQSRVEGRAQPWTWTVEQVLRMLDVGLLHSGDRSELIEGELVRKEKSSNGPHVTTVNRLTMRLAQASGDAYVVSVQNPLVLGIRSMPEPDLAVHRAWDDDRTDRLPSMEDVVLVVEVADSTVASDRRRKIPLYARYDCPELWFVDQVQGVLERCTDPGPDGFVRVERLVDGQVAPRLATELRIDVAELLRGRTG